MRSSILLQATWAARRHQLHSAAVTLLQLCSPHLPSFDGDGEQAMRAAGRQVHGRLTRHSVGVRQEQLQCRLQSEEQEASEPLYHQG